MFDYFGNYSINAHQVFCEDSPTSLYDHCHSDDLDLDSRPQLQVRLALDYCLTSGIILKESGVSRKTCLGSRGPHRPPGGVEGQGTMPPEVEEILSFRSQFAVFWHKKTTTDFFFFGHIFFFFLWSKFSSRGNPRYRGNGYCL